MCSFSRLPSRVSSVRKREVGIEGEIEPSVNSHSWAPLEHWEVLGQEQSGRVDKQNRQALKKAEQTWFSGNHLSLTDWSPG